VTPEQLTDVLTNVLTGSGVVLFVFYLVRSLKREIASLHKTIDQQTKTFEVMEKRVLETEKVGNIYRDLIDDLPGQVMKYKTFLNQTKDEVISHLQQANDASVQESRELEIRRLELQEMLISEIPKLRDQILLAFQGIEQRLTAVPDFVPVTSGVPQKKVTSALKQLGVIDAEYVDVDDIRGIDRTASYSSLPSKSDEEENIQTDNAFLQLLPGLETHSETE
jgi:hypothetical protein